MNTQYERNYLEVTPNIQVASQILERGFSHIASESFQGYDSKLLGSLQDSYHELSPDVRGGGRFRAHSRYLQTGAFRTKDHNPEYWQSKEYNYDDGDVIRQFEPISSEFLNSSIVQGLIDKDLQIAKETQIVDFKKTVVIGLHQIRYLVSNQGASYSSPIWLHKDDEAVVFIHLFNLHEKAIGGDNLIASKANKIENVLRLTRPLEALVVSKKVFHAVTPIGSLDGSVAYRDILLVTFDEQKGVSNGN